MDGGLLCLVDQPHLRPETFKAVVEVGRENPDQIIIPTYQNRGGHPVFIPKLLFKVILDFTDTSTLREVFNEHQDSIKRIHVNDPGLLKDTDYPEDLKEVESLYNQE